MPNTQLRKDELLNFHQQKSRVKITPILMPRKKKDIYQMAEEAVIAKKQITPRMIEKITPQTANNTKYIEAAILQ